MSTAKQDTPQKGRFLTGSTMGHVVRMTLTGAIGLTFVFLVDAANLFWLSRLGDPQQMAAIGFGFAIQFFSISVGIGMMIASNALVSRRIGEGQHDLARRVATSAAVLGVLIKLVVAAFVIGFRHELVALVGARGETAVLAARYLAITMTTLPLMAISMIANGALRAHGDGKRSMYVTLTSGFAAMLIDPVLILWLGLDGAAIGLVLSRFVMLFMAVRYAVGLHDLMARPAWADVRSFARPFLAIAVPAVATQMATPFGNSILTSFVAPHGDAAVAGWAVVGRLTVMAFGGLFALSGAIGGIFGQNFGARQFDRVESTYRDSVIFAVVYALATWALLAALGPEIAQLFDLTPDGTEVLLAFTRYGAGAFALAGTLYVSNAAFNALGKPTRSTINNWLRDGMLTWPCAVLFTGWFAAPGVIYAQSLAGSIVGVFACIWGWRYVHSLRRCTLPPLDLKPPRPYASPDRYRRR